jgi:hypothetical protein
MGVLVEVITLTTVHHLIGFVVFDQHLHLLQLILYSADLLAKELDNALTALLAGEQILVYLGET